jgi:MFS family permease
MLWGRDKSSSRYDESQLDRHQDAGTTAVLFLLLGLPSWTLVDGTWAALSQLATALPEGYRISSYLMLSLTLGNSVSILTGGCFLRKASFQRLRTVIGIIILTGLTSGIGLSLFWQYSVQFGDTTVSLALYVCFFFVGSCATMSNVTHMTFVSHWAAANTTWLATGMGLGSMCAGLLSLLQGLLRSQGSDGFSVQVYYLVLALLFVPAFTALQFLRTAPGRHQLVNASYVIENKPGDNDDEDYTILLSSTADSIPFVDSGQGSVINTCSHEDGSRPVGQTDEQFVQKYYAYLIFQVINASMGFGLIPSIISYVCGKFENGSLLLLLATSISAVVDPVFRALTIRVRIQTFRGFCFFVGTLLVFSLILFTLLWVPRNSPMFHESAGALVVVLYPAVNAINVFTNTSIFLFFKSHVDQEHMQRCYRIGGVATQCGSIAGTLLAFFLIVFDVVK